MTSRTISLLALVSIFVIAMAGCGGGDDEGGSASGATGSESNLGSADTAAVPPVDRATFIKQANAVCKPGKAKLLSALLAYQQKHLNEPSTKVVPDTTRKVIKPELEAQIEKLRALGVPSGDEAEVEKFFTALLQGADEIIAEKPPTFDEAERMLQQASDVARHYGIDECEYVLVDKGFNTKVLNE
jgi:hypothetical protein